MHFANTEYLGIDFNERYIEVARRRYKRNFIVADVTQYSADPGQRFDFILVNSLLHHINTPCTMRVLSHLNTLLTNDGHIHILELVQPEQGGIAYLLTRWDRGAYSRPVTEWRQIFSSVFEIVECETYGLKMFGKTLWNMIYCKGRVKR